MGFEKRVWGAADDICLATVHGWKGWQARLRRDGAVLSYWFPSQIRAGDCDHYLPACLVAGG